MFLFPVRKFTIKILSSPENITEFLTKSITRKTFRLLRRYETQFYGCPDMPGAKFRPCESHGMAIITAVINTGENPQASQLNLIVRPAYPSFSILMIVTITIASLIFIPIFQNGIHHLNGVMSIPIIITAQLWWSLGIDHRAACVSIEGFIAKAQQQDLSHSAKQPSSLTQS